MEPKYNSHLITLAIFRYALGRRSYVVSEITDWLKDNWEDIGPNTRKIILDEISDSLYLGSAGDPCDMKCWESVREMATKGYDEDEC